jgi:hypothetical protein
MLQIQMITIIICILEIKCTSQSMLATNSPVKIRLLSLLDELVSHDGYGSLKVEIRLLRRGQKEIIIDAGKQYRYVVDFLTKNPTVSSDDESNPIGQ